MCLHIRAKRNLTVFRIVNFSAIQYCMRTVDLRNAFTRAKPIGFPGTLRPKDLHHDTRESIKREAMKYPSEAVLEVLVVAFRSRFMFLRIRRVELHAWECINLVSQDLKLLITIHGCQLDSCFIEMTDHGSESLPDGFGLLTLEWERHPVLDIPRYRRQERHAIDSETINVQILLLVALEQLFRNADVIILDGR